MFFVYVLVNDQNNKIYIGQTSDLQTRLKRHNGLLANKKKSYTKVNKGKGNWNILYKEIYNTRKEVMIREKYLKSHIGRDWLKQILGR